MRKELAWLIGIVAVVAVAVLLLRPLSSPAPDRGPIVGAPAPDRGGRPVPPKGVVLTISRSGNALAVISLDDAKPRWTCSSGSTVHAGSLTRDRYEALKRIVVTSLDNVPLGIQTTGADLTYTLECDGKSASLPWSELKNVKPFESAVNAILTVLDEKARRSIRETIPAADPGTQDSKRRLAATTPIL